MCHEVCVGYGGRVAAESLLFVLCKRVYHHLHGYRYDLILPYSERPRREVYEAALRRIIKESSSEAFDPIEIAARYMTLDRGV
jgi:hypothetical protein